MEWRTIRQRVFDDVADVVGVRQPARDRDVHDLPELVHDGYARMARRSIDPTAHHVADHGGGGELELELVSKLLERATTAVVVADPVTVPSATPSTIFPVSLLPVRMSTIDAMSNNAKTASVVIAMLRAGVDCTGAPFPFTGL